MQKQVMEKRIKQKLDEINKLYEEGKIEHLPEFAGGMAAGVQQTLSWLSDPAVWMDPVKTIWLGVDAAPDIDQRNYDLGEAASK